MSDTATDEVRRRAFPAFTTEPAQPKKQGPSITRREAAYRLGVAYGQVVNKFIDSGLLAVSSDNTISSAEVDALIERPYLRAVSGELSVLRTSGKTSASSMAKASRHVRDPENSDGFYGISVDDTDSALAERGLEPVRATPSRVLGNRLLVMTTGQFPIALWSLDEVVERTDKEFNRSVRGRAVRGDIAYYLYSGTLLARLRRRDAEQEEGSPNYQVLHDDPRLHYVAVYNADFVEKGTSLYDAVEKIMTSRIRVLDHSSQSVGYLNADSWDGPDQESVDGDTEQADD